MFTDAGWDGCTFTNIILKDHLWDIKLWKELKAQDYKIEQESGPFDDLDPILSILSAGAGDGAQLVPYFLAFTKLLDSVPSTV